MRQLTDDLGVRMQKEGAPYFMRDLAMAFYRTINFAHGVGSCIVNQIDDSVLQDGLPPSARQSGGDFVG